MKNLSYRELQIALKTLKAQGLTEIRLNSKKEILQAEYNKLTKNQETKNEKTFNEIVMDFVKKTNKIHKISHINHMIQVARQHYDVAGCTGNDIYLNFILEQAIKGYSTKYIEYTVKAACEHLMSKTA